MPFLGFLRSLPPTAFARFVRFVAPMRAGVGAAAADGMGDASPMAPDSALAAARAARLRAMLDG